MPVPTGSCTDLTFITEKEVTKDAINAAIKAAASGRLKEIIEFTDEPIVSSDIIGNTHSTIFDGGCTMCSGKNMAKILSWYDNEWGYSCRVVDLMALCFHQSTGRI